MVVQHNLQAMNSNRMLGITQGTLSSSTEKLSSGYKINRAADDAAGLSISEKMRKQIRGLTQASANAEDGISSVQTAEGALSEVTDMLQRMNELAVQAANGTNSTTDRQYIQDEIDQLVTEIDRVSETTKFNETYLLKGDDTQAASKAYSAKYSVTYTKNVGSNSLGVNYHITYKNTSNMYIVSASIAAQSNASLTADVISSGSDITKYLATASTSTTTGNIQTGTLTFNGDKYVVFKNDTISYGNYVLNGNNILSSTLGKDTYILNTDTNEITQVKCGQDLSNYFQNMEYDTTNKLTYAEVKSQYRLLTLANVTYTKGGSVAKAYANGSAIKTASINSNTTASVGANVNNVDYTTATSTSKLYDADGNEVSGIALKKYIDSNGNYVGGLFADSQATSSVADNSSAVNKLKDYVTVNSSNVASDLSFTLHVGADSSDTNKITTNIQSMSSAALGIDVLKSTSVGIVDDTGANATDAIDIIADALQKVSTQRSALGAVQNRLEHTINNLNNVVENTTSAESQIRDTDMATEMVTYSNANILAQAGQAMLAQANQSNQGVLSLIG